MKCFVKIFITTFQSDFPGFTRPYLPVDGPRGQRQRMGSTRRPLNKTQRIAGQKIIEAEIMQFIGVVNAIQVEVMHAQAREVIALDHRKRGTFDVTDVAQCAQKAAGESGFTRREGTFQQDQHARLGAGRQGPRETQCRGFVGQREVNNRHGARRLS